MIEQFRKGNWHDGIKWHPLHCGRALTLSRLKKTKKEPYFRNKNAKTTHHVVSNFKQEHNDVLQEWSYIITGFWNIEQFIQYMSTHPYAFILEFRLKGQLIGFDWLIILDCLVVHQLFPWQKKRFSKLGLGIFGKYTAMDRWPNKIHLFGEDGEFKQRFGGWTYKGAW